MVLHRTTKPKFKEPFKNHYVSKEHFSELDSFTLMPYRCLMATLSDSTAGGATSGTPRPVTRAMLKMSHRGRQRFSPNRFETVQARHGQHQKP